VVCSSADECSSLQSIVESLALVQQATGP